jgi:hypothetical protein
VPISVEELNSKAVYVWCYGHRFNLVIEATSSCCAETKNALGLLEELYVFFSGHKRNSIFTEAQSQSESDEHRRLQLKRVCSTRWNSKEAAIETVIRCFAVILASLDQLASDSDSDSATKTGARGRACNTPDGHQIHHYVVFSAGSFRCGWSCFQAITGCFDGLGSSVTTGHSLPRKISDNEK